MEIVTYLIDLFLHLDKHLAELISQYGTWTYAILFLVIFCETGLVIAPFLPGDSLLFATGALAATGALDPNIAFALMALASVLGDNTNYTIGRFIGPKAFSGNSHFLKREYLDKTQQFYDKYGGRTIIVGRFLPIIRTFAPFVAGVAKMDRRKYVPFTIIGAIFWVGLFVYAGYFFGSLPFVKNNFSIVIVVIILISAVPAVFEIIRQRRNRNKQTR
ncbi:MAG: DedA family protein [bacterium]|nr:DedA family protein [bacterium]